MRSVNVGSDPSESSRAGLWRTASLAVAHHRDAIALGLGLADVFHLVLREAFGNDLLAADLAGHPRGHRLAVAGNHRHAAHAAGQQGGQRFLCLLACLVLESNPADEAAVAGHENQAKTLGFVEVHRLLEVRGQSTILEPLRAADEDVGAIHAGLDATAGGFVEVLRF